MRIREILQTIEQFAPLPLQEDFDNSGLQVGDPNREAAGVLLAIDVTENVVEEAIALGCNLIITHHPIAFRPFKSLTGKTYVERCIIQAIKQDIVIYAAHTNLDNAQGGVNYKLAEMLELQQLRFCSPERRTAEVCDHGAPTACRKRTQRPLQCRCRPHRQLRQLQL